jgi:hypothetical protein
MRKVFVIAAALLFGASAALAQDSNSNSNSAATSSQASSSSASSATVQGCLMGSNGSYTLTDATGVIYQLQGDDAKLSSNANSEVEVMGTVGATASASASNPPGSTPAGSDTNGTANPASENSGASGTGASNQNAAKTLTMNSIHKVADSCPVKETPQQ